MNKYSDKIAITTGDINGIGSEIVAKSLDSLNIPKDKFVIISDAENFRSYSALKNEYDIIDINFEGKQKFGEISKYSGDFSFRCLKKACEIRPKAIVTAPVSKEALHLAGHFFNGQTEILEHYLAHDNQKAEMLFISQGFNVLLLTRHCPLNEVSKHITKDFIIEKVERLKQHYNKFLGISNPKFALCALNPHAGEGGILGTEEEVIIKPAVKQLNSEGISITNPLPADTLFIQAARNYIANTKAPYDCYIAMYHDQGLIPIKSIAAEKTVNMTIGLDIIRTSPSHGTAFDIAGKNIANPQSMIEAIKAVL